MAKATVTHACGCQREHNFTGPYSGREKKAAWMRTVPCAACKTKADAAERIAVRAAQPAIDLQAETWPELTGSDKQIAWANDIRREAMETVCRFVWATSDDPKSLIACAQAQGLSFGEAFSLQLEWGGAADRFAQETVAARHWIDGRAWTLNKWHAALKPMLKPMSGVATR